MSNWKTTRGDWLPLRTRDGAPARVGPGDSPTSHRGKQHHHQPGQFDSHTGTPRHQPLEAASIVLPPGQMPAAASSSSQPSGGGGGSIPFYNPMNSSGSGNGNAGGLFDFLSGQQNESSEKQIHAPYFVSELLPPPQQQQQQNRGAETRNGSVASSSPSLRQQQQRSPSIRGLSSTSSVTESVDRNNTISQQQQQQNNNNNNATNKEDNEASKNATEDVEATPQPAEKKPISDPEGGVDTTPTGTHDNNPKTDATDTSQKYDQDDFEDEEL